MRKHGIALILLVAALVLTAGYELGKGLQLSDIRQPTIAAASPSGRASPNSDTPNTWQMIVARTSPSRKAASDDTKSNERQAELPTGPFGHDISTLKRLADAGNADAAYALAKGYRPCEFFVPPKSNAEVAKRAEDTTVTQLGMVDQIVDQVNLTECHGAHCTVWCDSRRRSP